MTRPAAQGSIFFDTAHLYTGGVSEAFLGTFVDRERDDLYIATKAGDTGGIAALSSTPAPATDRLEEA